MTSQERHEARYQRRKAARQAKHRARIAQYDNFDRVADVSSLVDANYNARKGVMWKASVARYNARYFKNSIKIHKTLMRGGDTRRGFYHFGIVERGKKRAIHSLHYSERVVRRSACTNALVPILSSNLIYDNGASLEGKGISFAVKRCAVHLHEFYRETGGNDGYILLIDYRAFFDNINLDNLKRNVIDRHILDQRLNALAKNFVDAPNLERIKYGQPTKENGLYIGPEDSQIFAIAYPNSIRPHHQRSMAAAVVRPLYGRFLHHQQIERTADRVSPPAVWAVRRKGHYPESQKDADSQAAPRFYLPKDQIHPVTQRQGITAALPRERHPGAPQNQEVFQFPASGTDDDGTDSHLLYVVARVAFQKAGPPFCSLHRFAVL